MSILCTMCVLCFQVCMLNLHTCIPDAPCTTVVCQPQAADGCSPGWYKNPNGGPCWPLAPATNFWTEFGINPAYTSWHSKIDNSDTLLSAYQSGTEGFHSGM